VLLPKDRIDRAFLKYACLSPSVREELQARVTGTSGSHQRVRPDDALTIEISIPVDPGEQRAIAHILGTLDDKIELNRKMNETLEAMARAIFKSWFVDFDPVRAKMEGRWKKGESLPGLPAELWDLFPSEFEESELGPIPRGWRVGRLGEVVEFAYGKALKENDRVPGNIPVFGSNGQVGWHNEKLVNGPGIIIGRKGNPGVVTWAATDFYPIDTTFYLVTISLVTSLYFLFYSLKSNNLGLLSSDSAVPGLNRTLAYDTAQLLPDGCVLDAFDKRVCMLFDARRLNDKSSAVLAAIRDALLPKLISGELRVPDAEKLVADL
jgi:type I restriction enzyme S subunit